MLRWSLVFLIITLIAALLGYTPIAGASYAAAKTVFFIFLVLFVVSLLFDAYAPSDVV